MDFLAIFVKSLGRASPPPFLSTRRTAGGGGSFALPGKYYVTKILVNFFRAIKIFQNIIAQNFLFLPCLKIRKRNPPKNAPSLPYWAKDAPR